MSKRPPIRKTSSVRAVPWSENLREFYRFAADDWTPPQSILSRLSPSGKRLTVIAKFTQPDGTIATLTTSMRREEDGRWYAVEERMNVHLTWRPEKAANER